AVSASAASMRRSAAGFSAATGSCCAAVGAAALSARMPETMRTGRRMMVPYAGCSYRSATRGIMRNPIGVRQRSTRRPNRGLRLLVRKAVHVRSDGRDLLRRELCASHRRHRRRMLHRLRDTALYDRLDALARPVRIQPLRIGEVRCQRCALRIEAMTGVADALARENLPAERRVLHD